MSVGMKSFIVILVYLLVLFAVTIYSYKQSKSKEKNAEEFFLAGRGVSSVILPLTMISAMQSTFAFLGAPGMFYMHGIGFLVMVLSQVWVALMIIFFGQRIWRLGGKYGYMSMGDFLEDRFESRYLKLFSAAISTLMTVVFLAMQYVGSARAIEILSRGEVPYIIGLLIIAFFSMLYVIIGGAGSVVLTDAVQAVVLIGGIILAAFIALVPSGGISGLFKKIIETNPALLTREGAQGFYTNKNWIMQFLVLPFGIWLCPHVWNRSLMAEDEKALVMSALSIPVSQIVIYATAGLFIGLSGHVLLTDVGAPDNVLPLLMNQYANWFVAALVIAASIAAGISTINSMILVSAQLVSQDILKTLRREKLTDSKEVVVSRIIAFLIVVVGVLIAYNPPQSLVTVVIDVAYSGLAQIAPAFILGLYWKECTKEGAAIGMTMGIVILFATRILHISPLGMPGFLFAFIINILLTIVVSKVTKDTDQKVIDRIFIEG